MTTHVRQNLVALANHAFRRLFVLQVFFVYHSLLHIAFKHAVKRGIILANPCDRADRPKATQYIASYYNQEEIKKLLDCLDNEPMRIAVILTAYYGLRRSEVLGIKWSAID